MEHTPQLWHKFYETLGFLFYSLSFADGSVKKQEVETVKKLLRDDWLGVESSLDEYGYDAAYQLEAVFDWLCETQPSAASAFKRFRSFVIDHPMFIDQKLKEKILDSANQIISSYAQKNKAELGYLYQLQESLR